MINLTTDTIMCLTSSPEYDHQVAWSPDSTRIVFERDFGSSASIYMFNADGSHVTRLTAGMFFDTGPAFSPDGRLIAFGRYREGVVPQDLWTLGADGHQLHQMLQSPFSEASPNWQPLRH